MKHGNLFEYDNQLSQSFGLSVAYFDNNDNNELLTREVITSDFNKYRNKQKSLGVKYSNSLNFKITVIKDICTHIQSQLVFTRAEISKINAWLMSAQTPRLFHMYDSNGVGDECDYFGIFTNVEPNYVGGDIVGLTYTFQSNSPYAYSPLMSQTIEAGQSMTFDCESDDLENYIYPLVTVVGNSEDNNVGIINETDGNKKMMVKTLKNYNIYFDCENLKVYDDYKVLNLSDVINDDIGSFYWFRLLPRSNTINIQGNAKVTFSWRSPKKVGEY